MLARRLDSVVVQFKGTTDALAQQTARHKKEVRKAILMVQRESLCAADDARTSAQQHASWEIKSREEERSARVETYQEDARQHFAETQVQLDKIEEKHATIIKLQQGHLNQIEEECTAQMRTQRSALEVLKARFDVFARQSKLTAEETRFLLEKVELMEVKEDGVAVFQSHGNSCSVSDNHAVHDASFQGVADQRAPQGAPAVTVGNKRAKADAHAFSVLSTQEDFAQMPMEEASLQAITARLDTLTCQTMIKVEETQVAINGVERALAEAVAYSQDVADNVSENLVQQKNNCFQPCGYQHNTQLKMQTCKSRTTHSKP